MRKPLVLEKWQVRVKYRSYCQAIDELEKMMRVKPYPDPLKLHVALAYANAMAEDFHGLARLL